MSDNFIINIIGVIRVSVLSFTKLVRIGSKSEDLHGANRTKRHTSSSVTQVRLCRTFQVSGGFNTPMHEREGKEERIMKIL